MSVYIREDQAHLSLDVKDRNGNWVAVGDGNSWLTFAGADLTATSTKTRPGGMGKEIAVGGPATRGDATVETQFGPAMLGQHAWLESRVGKGDCKFTATYLDDEGNTLPGAQFVATGKLGKADVPNMDGTSGTVGKYSVIIHCDEVAR